MFTPDSIRDADGDPVTLIELESFEVRPKSPTPTAFHAFHSLGIYGDHLHKSGACELADLHRAQHLRVPDLVSIHSFEIPTDFYAWDFIYQNLYRKGDWAFNGTIHPLIAAQILEEQWDSELGPLVKKPPNIELQWQCNTFFWGSLFMLTMHQIGSGQWVVRTYPVVEYPRDHPRPDELAPTSANWIREGRLFLATF